MVAKCLSGKMDLLVNTKNKLLHYCIQPARKSAKKRPEKGAFFIRCKRAVCPKKKAVIFSSSEAQRYLIIL